MIISISRKLSKHLAIKHNMSEEKLHFGTQIILNLVFTFILILMFSLIFNVFFPSLVISLAFCLLRHFTGGYHLKTSDLCMLASASMVTALAATYQHFESIELYLNIASILIVITFAPITYKFKFSESPRTYIRHKVIALVFILLNFVLLNSLLLTVSFFFVALLIIPAVINKKLNNRK